jgi:hypothetical protein
MKKALSCLFMLSWLMVGCGGEEETVEVEEGARQASAFGDFTCENNCFDKMRQSLQGTSFDMASCMNSCFLQDQQEFWNDFGKDFGERARGMELGSGVGSGLGTGVGTGFNGQTVRLPGSTQPPASGSSFSSSFSSSNGNGQNTCTCQVNGGPPQVKTCQGPCDCSVLCR